MPDRRVTRGGAWWTLAWLAVALAGCNREDRPLRPAMAAETGPRGLTVSQLYPGAPAPTPSDPRAQEYEGNAFHISNGQTYFKAFNCAGCHFNGGGGIGPPLMDDQWIYGFQAANIYSTIVEGRPNGMPSFRNKIPDYQVWQLVAYVQAMSGQVPIDALPGRDEHMQVRRAEPITPYQGRIQTGHR